MKKTVITKMLSYFVCILLIAAMATVIIGCNDKIDPEGLGENNTSSTVLEEKGKGEKNFIFSFAALDDEPTSYKILTDKKTVGEALLELELIAGEVGDYGLMVTTVGGKTADASCEYWAFYENGEYAMAGVDSTEIVNGATYTLKIEKFK